MRNWAIFVAMSSTKYTHSSIFILLLIFITGCSGDSEKTTHPFQDIDLKTTPLFHYSLAGTMIDPPTTFPEVWNRVALKKAGIHQITMVAKGGKNPDDTLEMIRFKYTSDWKKLSFMGTKNDASTPFRSRGEITYSSDATSEAEIQFEELFGMQKLSKTAIRKTPNGYLLLISKRLNRFDTTWVVGSFLQPKAIVSKIGNSIFSVEVYLPDGSSNKDIARAFEAIPQLSNGYSSAQCSVVFTSNGRPVSAFQLNDSFSQVAQLREWTYKNQQLTSYTEWFGNTTVREVVVHYDPSAQWPTTITIDRNTYFCHYE